MKIINVKSPPPRPTEIWDKPCKNCPSAHGPGDPEAADIRRWYRDGEITYEMATFPCAWRPEKLCKGVCDATMNVN